MAATKRRVAARDIVQFVELRKFLERGNTWNKEMLAKHVSQKAWLDESQGHDSYLQTLRDLDEEGGRMSGRFAYAEGWRRHLHLGFCGPDDDPLADALGDLCEWTTGENGA